MESIGECTAFQIANLDDGTFYFSFVRANGNEYIYIPAGTLYATYPATIIFTTPFEYSTSPAFYNWFIANATQGVTPDPEPSIPLSGDLAVGNLVTFDDKSWRVVHNDGSKWYLASENIIERTAFNTNQTNNTYAESILYDKCTDYLTNISTLAQKYMVDVSVSNVTAKVFVPTYEQVSGGFEYYNSASNRIATYNGDAVSWWTSSPYSGASYVYMVLSDGNTYYFNSYPNASNVGFRPHICIDTSIT